MSVLFPPVKLEASTEVHPSPIAEVLTDRLHKRQGLYGRTVAEFISHWSMTLNEGWNCGYAIYSNTSTI